MKIIVSDFDNTFYTKNIEKNVKMINDFMQAGNIFIIATGRPLYLLKPDLERYNVKYNFLICNDGAVIFNEKEEIIDKTNIDYTTAVQIYNLLKRQDYIEHAYIDAIYDFGELDSKDYNGILALPYDRDMAQDLLVSINKKYPTIQGYMSHKWLNILSIDASKGNAIKYLENKYSWNSDNIYTIGDNYNDISMTGYKNSYGILSDRQLFLDECAHIVSDFGKMMEDINEGN